MLEKFEDVQTIDFTKDVKTVRVNDKKYVLPKVLFFDDGKEGVRFNARFYEVTEYRKPLKGEWFLSGAVTEPYLAPNNLSAKYLIAIPTHKVRLVETRCYEKGSQV